MIKKIYEPVFGVQVIFANGIFEQVKKRFKKYKYDESYAKLAGSVTFLDTEEKGKKYRDYLIHIEDPKDFYCLLHEVVHLVVHIFTDRGVEYSEHNNELIAYYQTFWFKKLWRITNKK